MKAKLCGKAMDSTSRRCVQFTKEYVCKKGYLLLQASCELLVECDVVVNCMCFLLHSSTDCLRHLHFFFPPRACHSGTSCHAIRATSCHAIRATAVEAPLEPLQPRPSWSHCSPGSPEATAAQASWSHCSPGLGLLPACSYPF